MKTIQPLGREQVPGTLSRTALGATLLAFASATACITAGCSSAGEPPQARNSSSRTGARDAPMADAAPMVRSNECPPLGPLSEPFDASGTPLVFDFRHPDGFTVRSAEAISDSIYKIELVREAEGPNPGTISVMQLPGPGDSPVPPGIPTKEQVARSPALQAMADTLPEAAETIDFDGQRVVTYRAVTDHKVVYKFNLPDRDGYRTVDVHFFAPNASTECIPGMEALAADWVRQLVPRQQQ